MSADMFADFVNECAEDCVNAKPAPRRYAHVKFNHPTFGRVHLGEARLVDFTTDDGIVERMMRPMINADGERVAWAPVAP